MRARGIPSPRRDKLKTNVSLSAVEKDWISILSLDMPLRQEEIQGLREIVQREEIESPCPISLEHRFLNMIFVDKDVLCPRPDTETLVEQVLQKITEERNCFVADIGCGTGCIGLSIASARPNVKLYAVDISPAALACTKEHRTPAIRKTGWPLERKSAQAIPSNRPIDYLVSNPPYIPTADITDLEPEVRDFEPR